MTILSRSFFFSKGASDQVPQLGIEAASSPRHSSKSPVPSSGFSFQTISLLGQKGNGDASVDQQDNRPTSPSIPPPPTIGASSIFIWRSRDDPTVLSSPIQSFLPSSPNDRDTKQRSRSRRLPIFFHSYPSRSLLLRWKSATGSIENTDQTRAKIGDDSPLGQPHVERTCVLRAWVVAYY